MGQAPSGGWCSLNTNGLKSTQAPLYMYSFPTKMLPLFAQFLKLQLRIKCEM